MEDVAARIRALKARKDAGQVSEEEYERRRREILTGASIRHDPGSAPVEAPRASADVATDPPSRAGAAPGAARQLNDRPKKRFRPGIGVVSVGVLGLAFVVGAFAFLRNDHRHLVESRRLLVSGDLEEALREVGQVRGLVVYSSEVRRLRELIGYAMLAEGDRSLSQGRWDEARLLYQFAAGRVPSVAAQAQSRLDDLDRKASPESARPKHAAEKVAARKAAARMAADKKAAAERKAASRRSDAEGKEPAGAAATYRDLSSWDTWSCSGTTDTVIGPGFSMRTTGSGPGQTLTFSRSGVGASLAEMKIPRSSGVAHLSFDIRPFITPSPTHSVIVFLADQSARKGEQNTGNAGIQFAAQGKVAARTSGYPILGEFQRGTWCHVEMSVDIEHNEFALQVTGDGVSGTLARAGLLCEKRPTAIEYLQIYCDVPGGSEHELRNVAIRFN